MEDVANWAVVEKNIEIFLYYFTLFIIYIILNLI